MNDLFTKEDLIHSYSDQEAIEDGMLVNLPALGCRVSFRGLPIDRMTSHLLESLMDYVMPEELASTLRAKLPYARDTAEPGEERGVLFEIPPTLWLVLNERGTWTAMFPSDY